MSEKHLCKAVDYSKQGNVCGKKADVILIENDEEVGYCMHHAEREHRNCVYRLKFAAKKYMTEQAQEKRWREAISKAKKGESDASGH